MNGSHFGSDLAALNIQRGRDHAIGSYNQVRQYCGLQPLPPTFNDESRPQELSSDAWQRLKTVYQHPSDIELFPGGLSETPTELGKLGPTFACVVAKQFHDLKFGDRYEHNMYFILKIMRNQLWNTHIFL